MPDQEWYRAWRHDELANGFPHQQPRWKRGLSAALIVGAMVLIFLNVREALGW